MDAVFAGRDEGQVLSALFVAVGARFGDLVGFAARVEGGGVVGAGFLNGGEEILLQLVGCCDGGWVQGFLLAGFLLGVGWRWLSAVGGTLTTGVE